MRLKQEGLRLSAFSPRQWINDYTRVFLTYADGRRVFRSDVTVIEISKLTGGAYSDREAMCRVVIVGRLPSAANIRDAEHLLAIEITHGVCADPSIYRAEDVILRFTDCKQQSWGMRNVGTFTESGVYPLEIVAEYRAAEVELCAS